jgi:hypothetical protein
LNKSGIRGGGGDDHCQLEITIGPTGEVVSSSAKIAIGDSSFGTGVITASSLLVGAAPEVTAAIAVAGAIKKKLENQISKWNDHGGRANVPAVTIKNFNLMATKAPGGRVQQ